MLLLTFIGRDGSRHSFSMRYLGIWFRKAIGTTDLMSCVHICRNWLATLEYATYNTLDVYYKLHTLMWPRGVTLIPSDRDRYATRSKPGLYGSEATFLHIPWCQIAVPEIFTIFIKKFEMLYLWQELRYDNNFFTNLHNFMGTIIWLWVVGL